MTTLSSIPVLPRVQVSYCLAEESGKEKETEIHDLLFRPLS